MTNEEILEILKQRDIIRMDNSYNCRLWKTLENIKLRTTIEEYEIPDFFTFQEKMWFFLNNFNARPKCSVCGKHTHLDGINTGFKKVCSRSCSGLSQERKDKIKKTSLEKYGVEHPTKSQQYKEYVKLTLETNGYLPGAFNSPEHKKLIKEKYGVENVFQSNEIKDKIKKTNIEKYGAENPQQNIDIRRQTENTKLERYGFKHWNQTKVIETLMEKYGVDNPLKSQEIRDKVKNTCLERYGVEHVMHDPKIFFRCQSAQTQTRYKFKEKTLPSGKIIYYQGYEGYVIDYILLSGISEDDLENEKYKVPVISYEFEGKKRKYFPDIFIKSKNLLVEVKSTYTYTKDADKNLAKHWASKKQGYNHTIIIWDEKHNCVAEMI